MGFPMICTLIKATTLGLAALALSGSAASATTTPTGVTGSGASFCQYQPSLVLDQLFATRGDYPLPGDGSSKQYLGMVRSFAGHYSGLEIPNARGQQVSVSQYDVLYSVLGSRFGGDDQSVFNLPDLTGRTVIGTGPAFGAYHDIGERSGSAATVLGIANLPAHAHEIPGSVTSTTGSGTAFDNHEPTLALTQMIAVAGNYQLGTHTMTGEIGQFAGNFAPAGWLPADGRMLSVAANVMLYGVIGTSFGSTTIDGVAYFALPDLRGRTAVGAGQGNGLGDVQLGQQLGATSTVLTLAELPAHDHAIAGGGITADAGGGEAFDNYQPSLGLNYIIALYGAFPSGPYFPTDQAYFGEVIAFAGRLVPDGWAMANGRLLSINDNPVLYSLLGTSFGGDGISNFALPDLRGRSIIGSGNGFDLGTSFGSPTTTLTVANLAPHDHQITDPITPPEPTGGVPEPASWALMIAGFGLVGATLRRRRAAAV